MELGFAVPIFANPGVPDFRTPCLERLNWGAVAGGVREAERLGYQSAWVADHLFLGRDGEILECWTTLAAIAGMTSSLRLGTIHLGNEFRHAPLMAKMAATLQTISGNRLELFVDPGWRERELTAYGYDWRPDRAERAARLREALELAKLLWTGESVDYAGEHYRLDGAICGPALATPPRIWIGEAFDEATFDLIATHADVWNSMPAGLAVLEHKLAKVDEACRARGRDPGTLARTLETQVLIVDDRDEAERVFQRFAELRERYPSGEATRDIEDFVRQTNPQLGADISFERMLEEFLIGTPGEVAEKLAAYAELGISETICWFMDFPATRSMEQLATDVLPRLGGVAA